MRIIRPPSRREVNWGERGGHSIAEVGVESAGSMNHNVHYVETRKEIRLRHLVHARSGLVRSDFGTTKVSGYLEQ